VNKQCRQFVLAAKQQSNVGQSVYDLYSLSHFTFSLSTYTATAGYTEFGQRYISYLELQS